MEFINRRFSRRVVFHIALSPLPALSPFFFRFQLKIHPRVRYTRVLCKVFERLFITFRFISRVSRLYLS